MTSSLTDLDLRFGHRVSISLYLELTNPIRPDGEQIWGSLSSDTDYKCTSLLGFYLGSEKLSSGPPAFMASVLLMGLSL